MPDLPVEQISRNSELMQKANWKTGVFGAKKDPDMRAFRPDFKLMHHKVAIVMTLFAILVVVLAGVVLVASKLGPKIEETAQELNYEYPFDPAAVRIASDFQREKFLENFRKANLEKDSKASYKMLEENFTALRGFYSETQNSEYRTYLEQFKPFMEKHFKREVSQNASLYNIACLDLLCGELKTPAEIESFKAQIEANTSVDPAIKESVVRNFNEAGHSEDKNVQAISYINALSAMFTEYNRTKDEGTKNNYLKLSDFIKANYPEQAIPVEITLSE